MLQTVRTTIRIREDLLKQSRFLALEKETTLQHVINELLESGLGHITDLGVRRQAMARIDKFRESLRGKNIDINQLIKDNKKELQERTDRLIGKKSD